MSKIQGANVKKYKAQKSKTRNSGTFCQKYKAQRQKKVRRKGGKWEIRHFLSKIQGGKQPFLQKIQGANHIVKNPRLKMAIFAKNPRLKTGVFVKNPGQEPFQSKIQGKKHTSQADMYYI